MNITKYQNYERSAELVKPTFRIPNLTNEQAFQLFEFYFQLRREQIAKEVRRELQTA